MEQPHYAILRFAKYKGPPISNIEAHNERTKEKYASNPQIDPSRSHLNFHLIEPKGRYRTEADRQIAAAGCLVRKDSVRVVEAIVTTTHEFFDGKSPAEVRAFFQRALEFMESRQGPETILSAVVHMDEKTPHMHLCFVPLTADGRLSAKEILGNRKKLTQWQDAFWEHMVQQYPTLERGESASQTGRKHIPPRLFKEMTRLTRQREKLEELLTGVNPLNAKGRTKEIAALLDKYLPSVEKMDTQMKKYRGVLAKLKAENGALAQKLEAQTEQLAAQADESTLKKLKELKLEQDYAKARALLDRVPPEILAQAARQAPTKQEERDGQ